MKNKKLLMLVLAALSVSAVGAVCATGCNPDDTETQHEHSYSWHSNAEGHWEECDCNDVKGETTPHVDVKNNETDADGKDGKCDVCDYAIKQVVTFNMLGHGTAPDAQSVDFGGNATKPADPEDDDAYEFKGWFKDIACQTAFDFTAPVNDNVVVYAKWEENTTPGASKKYAYDLTLNFENLQILTSKGYTWYKYPVTEDGRYKVSLDFGANSQKCYFTVDGDCEAYGNGYDEKAHTYDGFKNTTIYIKLSCAETLGDEAKVSPFIEQVSHEPLPADAYLDGTYINGSGTYFILNRDGQTVTLNGTSYGYSYLGGLIDTLSFTQTMNLGGYDYTAVYKIKHQENGTYLISASGDTTMAEARFVCIEKKSSPVDVSEFAGIYAPKNASGDGIDEINIQENGSGNYIIGKGKNGEQSFKFNQNFDSEYGFLNFGQYLATLNPNGGIDVFSSTFENFITYDRISDPLPEKLPLNSSDEYYGSTYAIRDNYGVAQYWGATGNNAIKITSYDKTLNKYTVSANDSTYVLVFEGEGQNSKIKVYDSTGETLLDTLQIYFVDYAELPTAASTQVNVKLADFKKDFYHYKVTETGWYTFNYSDANLKLYYNLAEDYPTSVGYGKFLDCSEGAVTVYLKQGAIVGINSLYETDKPETVTFTVGEGVAPQGVDESNPYELNDFGSVKISALAEDNKLYVKFTPPAVGSYFVKVSCDGMQAGTTSYMLKYTVGGQDVGFDTVNFRWLGGLDSDNPNYKLVCNDTSPVMIVVDGKDYTNVVVTVTEDYTKGATDLGAFVDGTQTEEGLPASVTVSGSGTYKVANTFGSDLTLTSNTVFTAKLNGVELEVNDVDGVYTATIAAGTDLYVEVSAAVTFSVIYPVGTEKCPVKIELTNNQFSYGGEGKAEYFVFTQAGTYIIASYYTDVMVNGEYVDNFKPFEVSAGDLLFWEIYAHYGNLVVQVALPASLLGEYTYTVDGADTNVVISATSVTVGNKTYMLSAVSANEYTFKDSEDNTVTLTVSGSTLTLDGHALTVVDKTVFTADQVGTYKLTSPFEIVLTLKADGSGTFLMWGATYNITVTKGDAGVYSFEYNNTSTTFTFNAAGNVVINVMGQNTLIKEAPPVTGTTYVGNYETMGGADGTIELTLNGALTEGTLYVNDPDDPTTVTITLTKTGDNAYTFTDSNSFWTGSFTVSGDAVVITIDWTVDNLTLTKQA